MPCRRQALPDRAQQIASARSEASVRKRPNRLAPSENDTRLSGNDKARPIGRALSGASLALGSSGIEGDAFRVGFLPYRAFGAPELATDGARRGLLTSHRLQIRNVLLRPLPSLCF